MYANALVFDKDILHCCVEHVYSEVVIWLDVFSQRMHLTHVLKVSFQHTYVFVRRGDALRPRATLASRTSILKDSIDVGVTDTILVEAG